jgi:hypothetical protein
MAYVTTKSEYKTSEYEAQSTLYGENTGTIVVNSASKQMDAVLPASWPDGGTGPVDAGTPADATPADAATSADAGATVDTSSGG